MYSTQVENLEFDLERAKSTLKMINDRKAEGKPLWGKITPEVKATIERVTRELNELLKTYG